MEKEEEEKKGRGALEMSTGAYLALLDVKLAGVKRKHNLVFRQAEWTVDSLFRSFGRHLGK